MVVLVNVLFGNHSVENSAHYVFSGPGGLVRKVSLVISDRFKGMWEASKLMQENYDLRAQVAALTADEAKNTQIARENALLKKQLDVTTAGSPPLIMADILTLERTAVASSLVINRGSADGVQKGDPVIAAGNILIGKVSEVFSHSSRALLTDDPRFTANVRIGRSNTLAEAKGALHDHATLGLVTKSDSIHRGDAVSTSGIDSLPESLLVGTVDQVSSASDQVFQSATVRTLFDPSEGEKLFIIRQ